ncbi:hypothetical protein [Streptomyces ortus]|uniref:Uncharacterized protein n=1 Tax=Streptomyces ortus TaxID=2867268 RepID=A0ABT3UWY2_9ACTN|nr:hypothetical protein [Streptomyces ortus]MCX4232064.1 hypothetical protein [Streptomyces ortus]
MGTDGQDEVRWVHIPDGRTRCSPDQADSGSRATPTTPGCCYNAEAAEQAMFEESRAKVAK